MHKDSIKLVDQIILPARGQGVDWGATGILVAKRGNRELVWRRGCTGWAGRGSTAYYPAELQYFSDTSRNRIDCERLHDNEKAQRRLSPALLRETVPDDLFGVHIADYWKSGKTLIISEEPQP